MVTRTAPKKYADDRRTQVTPEWLDWDEDRRAEAADEGWELAAAAGFDPAIYFPEQVDKAIPEEGAWILILEEPHTPVREKFRLPLLSMWRARPHQLNDGAVNITKRLKVYPKQAVIATPAGDLHLWPHEYQIATNPMGLASDPDAELHALGGQPVLDEEELFYLQSRGIPRQQATMMLFDRIESLDFVYVTFPEEITSLLEGVGRPLHRHIALNPRPEQGRSK
ncbi:hypothetical protein ACFVU2_19415 [Leifsonia sp. NPDC058194]|uniref:SufD family Fe-S cluster assembly protein n=1 Tax=Leifsonia sp. NPDC058194 TaxID=3346374 RepID=UPI0036D7B326